MKSLGVQRSPLPFLFVPPSSRAAGKPPPFGDVKGTEVLEEERFNQEGLASNHATRKGILLMVPPRNGVTLYMLLILDAC